MTDNVIKSTDLNPKPEGAKKETPAKKAPAKKAAAPKKVEVQNENNNDKMIIVFESGASYTSQSGVRFTREDCIQEVSHEDAQILLALDNFRLPIEDEIEAYLASKED